MISCSLCFPEVDVLDHPETILESRSVASLSRRSRVSVEGPSPTDFADGDNLRIFPQVC